MEYIFLVIGFLIIIKASDVLVDSASSIAIKWKVPKMIIALTIVAFGTCTPELAISFNSISSGNGSMALANVIGSCIINIFLIIGLASFIQPILIKNQTIKKEMPILIIVTLGLIVLILNKMFLSNLGNVLNRYDGIILILLFSVFIYYIISFVRRSRDIKQTSIMKYPFFKAIIYLIISIVVITLSSNLIVDNALIIANNFNISQKIITLVVIVIGTSLPELIMTIIAARKNEFEMAIGNIIGTNIFNMGIVLGLPITIIGKLTIIDFSIIDLLFLFLSSFLLFIFARSEKKISKLEGIIMILMFLTYYSYAIFF